MRDFGRYKVASGWWLDQVAFTIFERKASLCGRHKLAGAPSFALVLVGGAVSAGAAAECAASHRARNASVRGVETTCACCSCAYVVPLGSIYTKSRRKRSHCALQGLFFEGDARFLVPFCCHKLELN